MEARLSKLYHNGYLNWPNAEQRLHRPIPEPLIWLGWRGALTLATERGADIAWPRKLNENQFRTLQSRLRNVGIRWVREPNWNQPLHDIAVNEFRLAIEKSILAFPHLRLERWISESEFRSTTDVIEFTFRGSNNEIKRRKKGVCPDGYFILSDANREAIGDPHRARFLVEIDMSTHANSRFGIEKAAAGEAYLRSRKYEKRFGSKGGTWLVITTGTRRMKNLMAQVEQRVLKDKTVFRFSTINSILSNDPFSSFIWWKTDSHNPEPLL